MKNEKIICRHCGTIIGFLHFTEEANYNKNIIISPNKNAFISKSKVRGTTDVTYFGDCDTEIGYILETQLTCKVCNKKTTKSVANIK